MTDFAASIHFRTLLDSEARSNGFVGGYGWFFGRFEEWGEFENQLRRHLSELGYYYVECNQSLEITDASNLNRGEQRELYQALDDYPLQYKTIHLYRKDDS